MRESISCSAFHARQEHSSAQPKLLCTLVHQTIKIVNTVLQELNPRQETVLTGDQSVDVTGKQVQWHYPEIHGEDKLVMMMGLLHTEIDFLTAIGDWLEGSGWIDLLIKSYIKTPGRADSMLQGKQVKRSRYIHQYRALPSTF